MKVYIRIPQPEDCEEFVANTKKSHGMHRPWVFPATSPFGYSEYLKRVDAERSKAFLICRVSDKAMVGTVSFSEISQGCMHSAFIGYWGVDGFAGNGYLTQGVALAIDHAFSSLNLHRVEACVQPQNSRSVSLLKRLGMEFEGVSRKYLCIGGEWKDHQRWSMLREDWRMKGGSLKVSEVSMGRA